MGRLVCSPCIRWSFVDGDLVISDLRTQGVVRTPDRRVAAVLEHFTVPRDRASFLEGNAGLNFDADQAEALVAKLLETGLLMDQVEAQLEASGLALGKLPRLTERITLDLTALAPYVDRHRTEAADALMKLDAARDLLSAVRHELLTMRQRFILEQRTRLGISRESRGLKIHLGAGRNHLPDWINVDHHGGELSIDLRWGIPVDDGTTSFVYAAHVLEHFNYPDEASAILKDVLRILDRDGVLRIVVPDIGRYMKAYVEGNRRFFEHRKRFWQEPAKPTLLSSFLHYAGAGSWPGYYVGHKFGYDSETLCALLHEVGFTRVDRSQYMKSPHPELLIDDRSEAARIELDGEHYSLFVEARP